MGRGGWHTTTILRHDGCVDIERGCGAGTEGRGEPVGGCATAIASPRATPMREAPRIRATHHPRVIQIDARAWVARLSVRANRRQTLEDIEPSDIAEIADLGFELVWLTASWTSGSQSRRVWRASAPMRDLRETLLPDGSDDDIAGSPFAVATYEPADSLGGEAGLATLRRRLSERGIGLILDFVANHVASDHLWVRRNPEWFVHAEPEERATDPDASFEVRSDGRHWIAHGRDPNFPPWRDTAQLDYRHPDVSFAMVRTLRDIATRCDGVVCSEAMLVLDDVFRATWGAPATDVPETVDRSHHGEFWWHAATAVREAYPQFLMIGEAYWGLEWRLQQLGFDYTFDKPLLDRLLAGDPDSIAGHLRADDGYQRQSVRFLETRVEPRIAARLIPDRHRVAALVAATVPGMFLVSDGQLDGATATVPIQFRRGPDEPVDANLRDFYTRLLHATTDEAFRLGKAVRLDPQTAWIGNATYEGIVARLWVGQRRQLRLAVANLTPSAAQCFVPLPMPEFAGKNVHLEDLLGDFKYVRSGDDLIVRGLYLDLPAFGHHLFRISRETPPASKRRRERSR